MTEFRYLNICTVYKCEWWAEIHKLISGNKCSHHLSSICIRTCIMNAVILLKSMLFTKGGEVFVPRVSSVGIHGGMYTVKHRLSLRADR